MAKEAAPAAAPDVTLPKNHSREPSRSLLNPSSFLKWSLKAKLNA